MTIQIRPARSTDVADLMSLWAVAGENADRPADSTKALEALLERDPDAVILAVEDGVVVGSVIAGWDGWRAHLYRLAVDPDHRRRGIATSLLDAAEQRLTELGAIRLDAMVLDANELGASAWRARGYRPQGDWTRWVREIV